MAVLQWDLSGQRYYETGISKGVLFLEDGSAVPWNGLIEVKEGSSTKLDPVYFDGVKYEDVVTLGDFSGSMSAFTYPDEFLEYEGIVLDKQGFYLADQPLKRFGLSYRTEISNDVSPEAGYKIHILYNLLAVPADHTYRTMSLDTEPSEFEWDISATPELVDGYRPTAHVILDSRKFDPFLFADLEGLIYGTAETDSALPSLNALVTYIQKWGRFIITDNGNGTWTATTPFPDIITMTSPDEFSITVDTAVYTVPGEKYEISTSESPEG